MHTKKSAVYFAAAWLAAIVLVPLSGIPLSGSAEPALQLSEITLVVGDMPAQD